MEKLIKITGQDLELIDKVCSLALQTGKIESAFVVAKLQQNISTAIQEAETKIETKIQPALDIDK